jgi:hypothetical protein
VVCGMMQVDEAVRETPICAMPNGGEHVCIVLMIN